jgi:molecular chaperone DnaK (HSP70)
LKLEAEAVKKALSLSASATFSVESLAEGVDFRSTINKTRYELLAGKVFQSFTRLIQEVAKKADLDLLDIDEVFSSHLNFMMAYTMPDYTIWWYIAYA